MKKMKYCPRCKSIDVRINITPSIVAGVPQKWECNDCNFESYSIFPEKEIDNSDKSDK